MRSATHVAHEKRRRRVYYAEEARTLRLGHEVDVQRAASIRGPAFHGLISVPPVKYGEAACAMGWGRHGARRSRGDRVKRLYDAEIEELIKTSVGTGSHGALILQPASCSCRTRTTVYLDLNPFLAMALPAAAAVTNSLPYCWKLESHSRR